MSFSFGQPSGQPASSGGDTPSLFGATSGSTPGKSLFGSTPASTSTNIFGSTPATSAPASGGNLFGGSTGTAPSLFGANSSATPASKPGGIFGQAEQSSAPSSGMFGGPKNTGGGASSSGGMFGGSGATAGGAGASGGLFGGKPAAAGAGTPGGLFGQQSSAGSSGITTPNANKTANMFGSTTPAGLPGAGPTFNGFKLGGAGTTASSSQPAVPATTSLFGQAPAASTSPFPNLGTSQPAATSGFGLFPKPASAGPPTSASGLFPPPPTTSAASNQSTGTSSLFTSGASSATPAVNVTAPGAPAAAKSLFDKPNNNTASAAGATSSATGTSSLFSPLGGNSQASTGSSTAATSAPSFPGFPSTSTAAPASSASGINFPPTGTSQPASTTGTASAGGAGGLGGPPKPPGGTGLGGGPSFNPSGPGAGGPALAAASAEATKKDNALGASTTGPKPTPASRLKNKSMDEIITRWANDLQKYQKDFKSQAEKVAAWDEQLVKSSEQIQKLYGSTLEAERATAEVERQLTAVENDQSEIEYWLEHYEKQVDELLASQAGSGGVAGDALQGPDADRERAFKTAEKLNDRLTVMGKELGTMVEEINEATKTLSSGANSDDPLSQIVRVLNGHLSQLQQIDQGTMQLQKKVSEAQKTSRLYGTNSGLIGNNSADDFGRFYTGRR